MAQNYESNKISQTNVSAQNSMKSIQGKDQNANTQSNEASSFQIQQETQSVVDLQHFSVEHAPHFNVQQQPRLSGSLQEFASFLPPAPSPYNISQPPPMTVSSMMPQRTKYHSQMTNNGSNSA